MRMRSFATTAVLAGALALAGTTAAHAADPNPVGVATDSPGVISGNVVQIPVDLDLNLCGNSINVIGLLNPPVANACATL